ncbi:MAG TPA: NADP-dependent oxidoreductase [Prolixibacteraceae bacterium]|jgi:NADPH-dependent curcumin reductase CurA|nr:NADP-dependent oxidoreductase [Prolixibacteraceae bacterium]
MDTLQIVLASRPQEFPNLDNFKTERIVLPDVQEDEVLVEGLYYSVDPYMRGRMNDSKSYISSYQIGEPIIGGVVGKAIESKSDKIKPGDIVLGRLPWRTRTVASIKGLQKIEYTQFPLSYFLGVLGMPGLTAYFGLLDIGKPKAGQTVVVSGAAGAVGIVVGQIAVIQGCRVLGIVGSDKKAEHLKTEYGFDEAINYKTSPDLIQAVGQACPRGVDIYFDNVGGEISDAVISHLNFQARIAICGQISLYNSPGTPIGPRLQPQLLSRSAMAQGFIVSNYQDRFGEGFQQLVRWVKEGKIKYPETIVKGFEQLPSALIGLFKGDNMGKMIVKI